MKRILFIILIVTFIAAVLFLPTAFVIQQHRDKHAIDSATGNSAEASGSTAEGTEHAHER